MERLEIVDVTDEARFGLLPACTDPAFDHRTCDYWEDADRGSKASRPGWLGSAGPVAQARKEGDPANPFAAGERPAPNPFAPVGVSPANPFAPSERPAPNPFAPSSGGRTRNPFLDDLDEPEPDNPFTPRRPARPIVPPDAPRKLQLLGRGLGVFGSYAKVLLVGGDPAAYCQFGPLSAYPRALRLRGLYPQLPDAPLPAVVTCIATTASGRGRGLALRLVAAVCTDLAGRGFAAVEAYPETRAKLDATPAARPKFWIGAGFRLAVDDERYPVMRREL